MERVTLVEQKRLQWAKEREEMAKLTAAHWESSKNYNVTRNTVIRTRLSSRQATSHRKPLRTSGHYGSTSSLETASTSLQSLDFSTATAARGGSMINIVERPELKDVVRKRSPSLPPIYTKDHRQHEDHRDLEVEGSRYTNYSRSRKNYHHQSNRNTLAQLNRYEEREGETSGYASDSIEPHHIIRMTDNKKLLPLESNSCYEISDTSLPPSRRFSELNRARWGGGVWYQENHNSDPPPPTWLERGLSRLDNSSQILVINHESASSPDSSTTGSTGSDSKTYLRGQNLPVDGRILEEREMKRQKALELQNAIKQQLEEKDRKRKEERDRKLREELEEEKRVQRERNQEKERFEEEQRRAKEKEEAKLKKDVAMREILEEAERLAKEEKRQKRKQNEPSNTLTQSIDNRELSENINLAKPISYQDHKHNQSHSEIIDKSHIHTHNQIEHFNNSSVENEENHVRMPVNKEVAIVLTGRLQDSDLTSGSNLHFLNLIVNSTSQEEENPVTLNTSSLSAIMKSLRSSSLEQTRLANSPRIIQNRLLTPTKYRMYSGRDCGTQTDGEAEIIEPEQEKQQVEITKEDKELVNTNKRDIDKSTNTGSTDDKNSRSKSQPRATLESRPRWNANRPGTRYRTQSEKDPHYQKKLRLRRRRIESSDDRSRSPSPDRRRIVNNKTKVRNNANRRRIKLEKYDAHLSMDSLHSVIPLRIDEHGKINIHQNKENRNISNNEIDTWRNQQILSQLEALKNGLLLKQQEWKTERSLVSPNNDFLSTSE